MMDAQIFTSHALHRRILLNARRHLRRAEHHLDLRAKDVRLRPALGRWIGWIAVETRRFVVAGSALRHASHCSRRCPVHAALAIGADFRRPARADEVRARGRRRGSVGAEQSPLSYSCILRARRRRSGSDRRYRPGWRNRRARPDEDDLRRLADGDGEFSRYC